MMRLPAVPAALAALLGSTFLTGAANAAVMISSGQTTNISCSGGVCAPTAVNAVLNVGDLENLMASGGVIVTTTGSGVQAADIKITDSLTWANASTLSLDAYKSIGIQKSVSVTGTGGLVLTTNDGGSKGVLTFGGKGNVTFTSLSSSLTINGANYTLFGDVKSLANAISTNPSGDYALASGYDASQDGTYKAAPIGTTFNGMFEGLGNTISNLSITDNTPNDYVGLFAQVGSGTVENLVMVKVKIIGDAKGNPKKNRRQVVGAMAGGSNGIFSNDSVDGLVEGGTGALVGGLVGLLGNNSGIVSNSHSAAHVEGTKYAAVGGLVGAESGTVANSYATGDVKVGGGDRKHGRVASSGGGLIGDAIGTVTGSFATGAVIGSQYSAVGGLVGEGEYGSLSNGYATGNVNGGTGSFVGGLIGEQIYGGGGGGLITKSYATGAVSGQSGSSVGGFAGDVFYSDSADDDYWDTTTSGTDTGVGDGPDTGVTGLTTAQLQSELPQGFSAKTWGENAAINNGLPYLLANPPPK